MTSDEALRRQLPHLALHFTKRDAWTDKDLPIFERGEGCHIWDTQGNRWLDGLAGLFLVNIGHGRSDIAAAAAAQMSRLAYSPAWSVAHPPAIEAADLITSLAPGDLDVAFFVSSGSEAVESAIKFARQFQAGRGFEGRTKVLSRRLAYHGTTLGALSATGLPGIRNRFGPLLPGFRHVGNTLEHDDSASAIAELEEVIDDEGPETIAMIIAEPVQNGGGAITPPDGYWPALRELCDRNGILLVADEVINAFGRLGHWFGSHHVTGVVPDLLTFAKGATSGYAPIGGMLVRGPIMDELMETEGGFTHGATWGGHPVSTAVAVANLTAMRDEQVLDNVGEHAEGFRARLDDLMAAHHAVRDVRGMGYFYAIELMVDRRTGRELTEVQTSEAIGSVLPRLLVEARLALRADDRGRAKLMLSPPLIADEAILGELCEGVDAVLCGFESWLAS